MKTNVKLLSELLSQVEQSSTIEEKVFTGFDGFVDKIKKAVNRKQGVITLYYETLGDFSDRIRQASGKSGQVELVTEMTKLGGNAPILSHALGKLGIESFCAGSMGHPEIHPVFGAMNKNCHKLSLLDPGESDAIEFKDGKMIFSDLDVFKNYDWNYIKNSIGLNAIQYAVKASTLLAFVDWANLPHASDLWDGVLHDVIKPSGRTDFNFLFDLCDPSKKTVLEIDEMLDLISCFSPYGKVTLGLNENETLKIWCAIHGVDNTNLEAKSRMPLVNEAGDALFKAMNIDRLLVHLIDRTIVFRKHKTIELQGRVVTNPKVLTGGGDNFNAGYCLGLLLGLSVEYCMLLGMAASGAYVQNGESPDTLTIIEYLKVWKEELAISQRNHGSILA